MADHHPAAPEDGAQKITEALAILRALDFPRAQLNEHPALTLLALLDLKPHERWTEAVAPLSEPARLRPHTPHCLCLWSVRYTTRYPPHISDDKAHLLSLPSSMFSKRYSPSTVSSMVRYTSTLSL